MNTETIRLKHLFTNSRHYRLHVVARDLSGPYSRAVSHHTYDVGSEGIKVNRERSSGGLVDDIAAEIGQILFTILPALAYQTQPVEAEFKVLAQVAEQGSGWSSVLFRKT